MGKLQFSMRPRIIQGDDLAGIYSSDDTCRIVYKNFYPQHTPVADYRVECILALNNLVQNEDLSIEFDYGGIKKVRAQTTWATGRPVGYNVAKRLYNGSDDRLLWGQTHDIASPWDSAWIDLEQSNIGHFKVGAGQTITIPEVKAFRWLSSALISDECEVFVGGHVTNTIDGYKPNGLYTGTYWNQIQNNPTTQSTFVHNGENWVDVGTEVTLWASQPNKGHTRRYQGGYWLQEAPFTRN